MFTSILILICKIVTFIGKLLGKRASAMPGKIAYDRDNKILTKIKYPKYVIVISGSSGKGSTTNVIAHILKSAGLSVAYNEEGSNGIYGITTLILNNTGINHKFKKDVLLVEADERHIKLAFKGNITHLVITNITRDQPSRNGNPQIIYNEIFGSITPSTKLIINADDPLVSKIKLDFKGEIFTYGIAKTKDSYTDIKLQNIDNAYCPKCHHKLKYSYYHYGHLGAYECPKGDFGRGIADFEADAVDLAGLKFKIDNQILSLNKAALYALYYTLAAYATASIVGIENDIIQNSLNENMIKSKRGHIYELDNRSVNMLESKNENALSYYQSLKYITDQDGIKTVILGFENVSRRYKYNDLSWLWDVEFEMLDDSKIDKIICLGKYKWDIATRLAYANIDDKKLIMLDDINDLVDTTKTKSKGSIFTMVCFDMTETIKNLINEG